jgi:hypothetical protein
MCIIPFSGELSKNIVYNNTIILFQNLVNPAQIPADSLFPNMPVVRLAARGVFCRSSDQQPGAFMPLVRSAARGFYAARQISSPEHLIPLVRSAARGVFAEAKR